MRSDRARTRSCKAGFIDTARSVNAQKRSIRSVIVSEWNQRALAPGPSALRRRKSHKCQTVNWLGDLKKYRTSGALNGCCPFADGTDHVSRGTSSPWMAALAATTSKASGSKVSPTQSSSSTCSGSAGSARASSSAP